MPDTDPAATGTPGAEQRAQEVFRDHIDHHALYETDRVTIPQAIAAAIRAAEQAAAEQQMERDCAALCPYCFGDLPSTYELVFRNEHYRHPCKCHVPDDWEWCKGDKIRRAFDAALAALHAPAADGQER